MLYIKGNKVYQSDSNGIHGCDVTGKDRVIERRELESVTVNPVQKLKKLPDGAVPATVEEVVAKFGITEANPLRYRGTKGQADD